MMKNVLTLLVKSVLVALGLTAAVTTNAGIHKKFLGSRTTALLISSNEIKGALSGLRQFLAAESPLKMMKNAFYFTSKALFVLKIFKFLSWLFGRIAKRLDKKFKVNFKFYDVTAWLTNNCNTHIAKYLEK